MKFVRNIAMMIRRNSLSVVQDRLSNFDSVAVLGPRQTGKTTMARQIADDMRDRASYLDLESAVDRRKLDDPEAYFAANRDKLIVLDEIQRAPEIFQILRGEIFESADIDAASADKVAEQVAASPLLGRGLVNSLMIRRRSIECKSAR